jgi:hypothetical protein
MGPVTFATTKRHESSRSRPKFKHSVMQPYVCTIVPFAAKRFITSLRPAFSKTGMCVDAEIGAGLNQEAHIRVLIRHMEAAG